MALTRKMLAAMEIEPEKIEQIISGHMESVTGLQGEIDSLKSENEQYKAGEKKHKELEKEFADFKKQVADEAKSREGKDYDKLLAEFNEFKADTERKAVRSRKEEAFKAILKDAGIPEKHWDKISKYSDIDGLELDDKGKITTAKDVMKDLKEEWGDHIETTKVEGTHVATPPSSTGGRMTREQIDAIEDTAARQAAMLENHDLYGI